jgi:hypothetical protein
VYIFPVFATQQPRENEENGQKQHDVHANALTLHLDGFGGVGEKIN